MFHIFERSPSLVILPSVYRLPAMGLDPSPAHFGKLELIFPERSFPKHKIDFLSFPFFLSSQPLNLHDIFPFFPFRVRRFRFVLARAVPFSLIR